MVNTFIPYPLSFRLQKPVLNPLKGEIINFCLLLKIILVLDFKHRSLKFSCSESYAALYNFASSILGIPFLPMTSIRILCKSESVFSLGPCFFQGFVPYYNYFLFRDTSMHFSKSWIKLWSSSVSSRAFRVLTDYLVCTVVHHLYMGSICKSATIVNISLFELLIIPVIEVLKDSATCLKW